mmetsp:Transcript_34080/g.69693  ORF Transcript_34080/g.69693 Transcript_34080/m.69693 type:complete len:207 (+) Transcript_34080:329-949(+)
MPSTGAGINPSVPTTKATPPSSYSDAVATAVLRRRTAPGKFKSVPPTALSAETNAATEKRMLPATNSKSACSTLTSDGLGTGDPSLTTTSMLFNPNHGTFTLKVELAASEPAARAVAVRSSREGTGRGRGSEAEAACAESSGGMKRTVPARNKVEPTMYRNSSRTMAGLSAWVGSSLASSQISKALYRARPKKMALPTMYSSHPST